MKISVMITCWNYGRFLAEAIESVLRQTYRDFDIMVVDDGSEDNTASVCRNYPQVRYIHCPHRGISAARNTAVQAADNELLAFLDADDQYAPEKLEKQMIYLEDHPECRIVFCRTKNYIDPSVRNPDRKLILLQKTPVAAALHSALFYRDVFDEVGPFNESYVKDEDTEWLLRVSAAGISTEHKLTEELYLRRIHGRNITVSGPMSKEQLMRMVRSAGIVKRNGGRGNQ